MAVESFGFELSLGVVVLLGSAGSTVVSLPVRGALAESVPVPGAAGAAWSPLEGAPRLPEPAAPVVSLPEAGGAAMSPEPVVVVPALPEPDRSPLFEPMPVEVESEGGAATVESEGSFAAESGAATPSVSLARGEASGVVRVRWRADQPVRAWPWRCSVFGFIEDVSLSLTVSSVVDCAVLLSSGMAVAVPSVALVVSLPYEPDCADLSSDGVTVLSEGSAGLSAALG